MKKNCIVAQSGGPTAAINASLAGVIAEAVEGCEFDTVYGAVNGILGVINESFLDLSECAKTVDNFLQRLSLTPAMYLGSCRYRLPDVSAANEKNPQSPAPADALGQDVYAKIFGIFEKMNISSFFYIGGNDSMDTVDKLHKYAKKIGSPVKIAGIPKTIDNDLVITDHTPGYGSACKYLASTLREIAYDVSIYPVESVTIVEIMGRDAGWLTAGSILARNESIAAPHLIYLPETVFDKERFIEDVRALLPVYRNIVVAVSEGVRDADGNYISASNEHLDIFGHSQLSGTGKKLEMLVDKRLGVKVRSIELNILQRCSGHMVSKTDIEESVELGRAAVRLACSGESGFMTVIKRISNSPYSCSIASAPVSEIANKAKGVPAEWISPSGNDVTDAMLAYVSPLIQGEISESTKDGVIDYLPIDHLKP